MDAEEGFNLFRTQSPLCSHLYLSIIDIFSKAVGGHFIPTKWEGNGGPDTLGSCASLHT